MLFSLELCTARFAARKYCALRLESSRISRYDYDGGKDRLPWDQRYLSVNGTFFESRSSMARHITILPTLLHAFATNTMNFTFVAKFS
jgi:hypothetical protein